MKYTRQRKTSTVCFLLYVETKRNTRQAHRYRKYISSGQRYRVQEMCEGHQKVKKEEKKKFKLDKGQESM